VVEDDEQEEMQEVLSREMMVQSSTYITFATLHALVELVLTVNTTVNTTACRLAAPSAVTSVAAFSRTRPHFPL